MCRPKTRATIQREIEKEKNNHIEKTSNIHGSAFGLYIYVCIYIYIFILSNENF